MKVSDFNNGRHDVILKIENYAKMPSKWSWVIWCYFHFHRQFKMDVILANYSKWLVLLWWTKKSSFFSSKIQDGRHLVLFNYLENWKIKINIIFLISFRLISYLFRFVSFRFVSFVLVSFDFVSFRSVSFRFISFLCRFALYRYPGN